MRIRLIVVLFVILCGFVLVACGADPEPTEVHITLKEYQVTMDKTEIPSGPVVFIIDNVGELTHELVLEQAGQPDTPFEENGEVSEAEDIESGTSTTLEWTLDEPGEFQLACHINENSIDHYASGMVQTFTVTGN